MIGLEISGLNEITQNLKKISDRKLYDETLRDTAKRAEEYAKMYAPELTGAMMLSIKANVHGTSARLSCDVPYAVYNEYGTIHMAAGTPNSPLAVVSGSGKYAFRPFMRPAAYRAMREAQAIFGQKLVRIWK